MKMGGEYDVFPSGISVFHGMELTNPIDYMAVICGSLSVESKARYVSERQDMAVVFPSQNGSTLCVTTHCLPE
jgi:hypothetical protein